ncbi:Nucleoporin autopeptidase [Giardia duodenalis]|uniref:Nucleoporin autopeptidase n=1 Tax=Giardia intestinalis (strain ATCC 50803 / WB clone C6) TaxID=184922 RepID=A8BRG2_GIAIC|nr:Nucleoporin autopeptidase [Giardia intestinalis]KAE8306010.1 Nucleoporin autopeptidase [Giardia intestinalis]|eukprot:XP_001705258.1 Hypothetical protein GL50803_6138 [Giardia lamblia ATCC 50803]
MAPLATSNIFARMDSECVYSPRAVPTGRPILDNRYRYNPSAELLRKLSLTELQRVNNFMVSNEYGMICWSGETDISGVDFTKDLVLEKGGCEVYPNGNAPPRGTKLNKHAIITLLRIEFFLPGPQESFLQTQVEQRTLEMGARFISFDNVTGKWSFAVDYFV